MKLIAVALVIAAVPAAAQDHAHCHAAPSPSPTHRDAVDHRHDQTTGVPHEGSTHHFLLAPDGGEIRLEATDAADTATRDRIRAHLQRRRRGLRRGRLRDAPPHPRPGARRHRRHEPSAAPRSATPSNRRTAADA